MRKPIPVIAIIIVTFALVFSSCKRRYMCACTHKGGRPEFKFDIDKKNIKDAKSECHAKDEMLGDDYKCELYYERF